MSAGPLAGMLVVDLSRYLPGPFTAHLLASLGARVIKVEEPRLGDPVRYAPPLAGQVSSLAAQVLRGVESVALDLKKPAGLAVLERLLARADILLETFRPGNMAKLGLEPKELRQRFPALVICSLSGWGQEGPLAQRSGHDLTYQAAAGSLAPTAAMPAVPSADLLGAWSAVAAVLAAVTQRNRSHQGSWVDASLYGAALHGNLVAWAAEVAGPTEVAEPHDLAGALPGYQLYRTSDDGWVALALLEEKFWRRFWQALGRKDLARRRLDRSRETRRILAEVMATRGRQEWEAFFQAHDLPGAGVLSPSEAATHPQAIDGGILASDPQGLPQLAFPALFDGQRPAPGALIPALGEHTAAVLEELQIAPGELPLWRARGGVGKRLGLKRWLARWLVR